MYCAFSGSSNTVSVPSVTVTESLVQVTVVAGPPVEIQVRVNMKFGSREKVKSADTDRIPVITISELYIEEICSCDKILVYLRHCCTVQHRQSAV